jgi:hypothetical protein
LVPANLWSALFFLVLVAPGLLYDLLSETKLTRPKETAFHEVGRIVLASLAFSAAPLLVLTVIGDANLTQALPDPSTWARAGSAYTVQNYGPIVFALVLQTALSCGLVIGFHQWRHGGSPTLGSVPTWRKVFRDDNPSGFAPVARVKLSSGAVYEGTVADYTQTFEDSRDLVLSPPLKVKQVGKPISDMPPAWQRMVIAREHIVSITVRYPSSGSLTQDA